MQVVGGILVPSLWREIFEYPLWCDANSLSTISGRGAFEYPLFRDVLLGHQRLFKSYTPHTRAVFRAVLEGLYLLILVVVVS